MVFWFKSPKEDLHGFACTKNWDFDRSAFVRITCVHTIMRTLHFLNLHVTSTVDCKCRAVRTTQAPEPVLRTCFAPKKKASMTSDVKHISTIPSEFKAAHKASPSPGARMQHTPCIKFKQHARKCNLNTICHLTHFMLPAFRAFRTIDLQSL